MAKPVDFRKEISPNIVRWASLDNTMNKLFDNFEIWKERDSELVNQFFNQPYFSWEESILNKFTEVDPTITFDHIENEGINLALLQYNNWERDFRNCLNKVKSDSIKKAFVEEIFDKVKNEIWVTTPPYNDFPTECDTAHFLTWTTLDVISYFQKVVDYLDKKQDSKWAKNTVKILKKIIIRNKDLNWRLSAWEQILPWVPLTESRIPADTKKSFDSLLSFEIGKEADRTINIAKDISDKVQWLYSNTFPAINTIIGENEKYRYDESKLWLDYKKSLQNITNNNGLSESEKERLINNLRWEYYIKYLKKIDSKIGSTIEQLYNNKFDYSKLDESVLKNYLDKVANLRLKALFENDLNKTLELTIWDIDEFENFYKKLADPCIKEIHLDNRTTPWTTATFDINIPVTKTIVPWEHPQLMNINEFWNKEKSYDYIPINYEIKKEDIKNLNIDMEDKTNLMNFLSKFESEDKKKYIINWENAWALIYLFFVINSRIPITQLDFDKQKEVEQLFGDTRKSKTNREKDTKENEEKNQKEEEEKKDDVENFINKIEKLWSWNKFKNWSEIWLPMENSELPWWWYQWMKIKISDVNKEKWTFTWKIFGWELKFRKNLEWKSRQFKMNEKTLDEIEKISKDSSKIWLLPNPDHSDFNSYKDKLNGKLWTWSLSFPDGVKWNGQKFTYNFMDKNWKETEKEVKYFWIPWDDAASYQIKYNPGNRSFKISATYNWNAKGKDWKSENVRYSYTREMDWNNFLIFFTQKWLTPQSEEDSKNARIKQDRDFKMVNWWRWKLNWFSLNNFKNVFKTVTWSIKKKIDDYNKAQDEKLQDIIIGDRWLYGKLANVLWFIPSIKYGLWELEQEYYNERDNRTRKKIEPFYKKFCADYDLPDTFDQEPSYIKIKWKWSLKNQILARVKNAKDRMWDPWIYQAAWLLLANIEKWWSAYRWLSEHENEWLWVKALLGKAHYEQFLRDKQKCIDAFSTEENKDKLQDALANSEMTYIINNVYWKDWGLLFWSHESRWLPWNTEKTNYIENPSKRILSEQFAKKLDDLTKDNFTKDGVISKMPKHNYFEKAENDFYRLIKSSRFSGAMSELEWMISLARTDAQVYATKKCYLILMLSGVLDFNWNKWLRKFAYTQWKTFWFAPAMLAKNVWHSEEIALLLDDFSGWDFSKHVTSYCHKKDLLKWKTDIKNLINQVNNWFNEGKMKDFDEYVESIPWRNWEWKSPALRKLQKDLTDYDNQNPDDIVLKNAKLINSSWLNASADAVATRLRVENWEFKWKDQDEKTDIAAFWKSCSKKIDNAMKNLDWHEWQKHAKQMLEKYLGWFWINWDSKQDIYKRINTACRYNSRINDSWKSDWNWRYCQIIHKNEPTTNKDWKPIRIDVPLWKIYDNDVTKILRYWLEWFVRTHRLSSQQLPTELKTALDDFQRFFEKAFYNGCFDNISSKINSDDKIFHLWWWDVYETIAQKDNNQNIFSDDDSESIDSTNFKDLEPKKQKALLRKIFNSDSYKNAEMSQMRKSLKNHWVSLPKEWKLFNDTSWRLEELQQYL